MQKMPLKWIQKIGINIKEDYKLGESKYRDTHFYVGRKGGVYLITCKGKKFIDNETLNTCTANS